MTTEWENRIRELCRLSQFIEADYNEYLRAVKLIQEDTPDNADLDATAYALKLGVNSTATETDIELGTMVRELLSAMNAHKEFLDALDFGEDNKFKQIRFSRLLANHQNIAKYEGDIQRNEELKHLGPPVIPHRVDWIIQGLNIRIQEALSNIGWRFADMDKAGAINWVSLRPLISRAIENKAKQNGKRS